MKKNFLKTGVFLNIIGVLAYLAVTAYLGTFSRYMSDDYCESFSTKSSSPLAAVITRYEDGNWRAANRYSNLFFVGVAESLLGPKNISIIPVIMVLLFGGGLVFLVRQVRIMAGIKWHISMDILWGCFLAFITILETPNRFQILYWRSSMATHFAPLVFLNFLVAALLARIKARQEGAASVWFVIVVLFSAFVIGGFSEPPVTVMIVGSTLALIYIWFFVSNNLRQPSLILAGSILVGAVLSLGVMAVSPAVSKLSATTPSFAQWLQRTFEYTYFFLTDTVKTLPIPILFSFLCPAVLMFLVTRQGDYFNLKVSLRFAVVLPFILALLIAAGFSTSAYGQSYPVVRARFFAYFFLTITAMVEGATLGLWLSRIKWKLFNTAAFEYAAILVLIFMGFYPFRAVVQVLRDVPEYSTRAQEWDRRNVHIYELRERGQTDLIVPQFGGIYDVKELDNLPTHWVNRCAAAYYGVNSISAVTIHGTEALEDYYNDFGN